MWTITLQSYHHTMEKHKKGAAETPEYPELFGSFQATLMTLVWSTLGLIEPDNIGIKYNENADIFLKVCLLCFKCKM